MSDYVWLNDAAKLFLERDYLLPGQTVDERVDIICQNAERILRKPGYAAKFKDYFRRGWYSLSSPIWNNFGNERGLPISCFGSHIEDSMESILRTHTEVGTMTKYGGGTSGYFGELRPRGSPINQNGHSSGSVHFMQLFNQLINIVSQGSTRRGQFAGYLPIDHADAEEFVTIRSEGHPIQDMSFGVCVPDKWLKEMVDGDMKKRTLWAKVLASRANTGYPYILFTDNANRGAPECYRNNALYQIKQSNLCTEIMLPNNRRESFVCDLASMNDLYFYDWKNTDAVEVLVQLLDAVMTEFIEKASKLPNMERAVEFARNHRALGIGQLGYHSLLQSRGIPFESMTAKYVNLDIAQTIKYQALVASENMRVEYGPPDGFPALSRRHTTLLAIAPTKSSSFILGQASEGIEPYRTNYLIKDLQKGKFTLKNPYLERCLEGLGRNTDATWDSILKHGGSVQHLDFLPEHDKAVFKTFAEISPREVIIQAAQRQKYIDQGQSLNLMIHPSIPVKDVNALILEAHRLGIKSLYYQHSVNAAQEFARDIMSCESCSA